MIIAWGRTIYLQFGLLAGKSAPHDFLQLLIYKATTFSDEIEQIDTVRAYHVSLIILELSNLILNNFLFNLISTEWTSESMAPGRVVDRDADTLPQDYYVEIDVAIHTFGMLS